MALIKSWSRLEYYFNYQLTNNVQQPDEYVYGLLLFYINYVFYYNFSFMLPFFCRKTIKSKNKCLILMSGLLGPQLVYYHDLV